MTDLFDLPFEEEPEREPEPAPPVPVTNGERRTPNVERQAAPSRRVFSVTELTVRVRDLLEAEFAEV